MIKDYFLKSGLFCVINGKVHDDMTFFVYRIDLFKAAVTASHSSCHDYQYRFLTHLYTLLSVFFFDSERAMMEAVYSEGVIPVIFLN